MKHSVPTHHESSGAFTLIELLVATVITLLLLFLIDQVFYNTVNAVGQGAALNDIIAASRSINEQLERDSQAMVGPHSGTEGMLPTETGGVLVILQREIPNAPYILPDGSEGTRSVRSDQLMFIRERRAPFTKDPHSRRNTFPICPSAESTFTSPDISEETAPYIRVWYGHVLRTDPDGTDPDDAPGSVDTVTANGALGQAGPNRLANNWVLGRQALFLGTTSSTIHVKGAWYNVGGATDMSGYSTPAAAIRYLFMGLTDYALFALDGDTTNGAMVGGIEPTSSPPTNTSRRLWSTFASPVGSSDSDQYTEYRNRAYDYTYGKKRLRVNPNPSGNTYDAWQIAQMHPYFMANVSDFIVEFAGDYFKTDGQDSPGDKKLDWIDGGNIRWLTHDGFKNEEHAPADATQPFTYPPPVGTLPYDTNPSALPHADAAFVFRHDDYKPGELNLWPYLIRIRYRVHDPRSKFRRYVGQYDTDNSVFIGEEESGMWFEKVIEVDRP